MYIRNYQLKGKVNKPRRVALVADLHDRDGEAVLSALASHRPDLIAIAGDLTNNSLRYAGQTKAFLSRCADIAPTYYSLGNHEYNFTQAGQRYVKESGARLLLDEFVYQDELCIGALRSRSVYRPFPEGRSTAPPHCGWLDEFQRQPGYKILISHHPEYYEPYLRERDIDLVLSGHAHGGQVRLLGRGLFSPGQGILPRYTRGLYDGRLVVSAGLANTVPKIPRLFNPTELVFVDIEPEK